MNTKERIVYISLELFAQKGFSGVSVRDIASVVGVRESGLYKHFKNKQDILDSIMVIMKERIELVYQENEVPEVMTEDVAAAYKELSLENYVKYPGICSLFLRKIRWYQILGDC